MFGRTRPEARADSVVEVVRRTVLEILERGPELSDLPLLAAAAVRYDRNRLRAYAIVWRLIAADVRAGSAQAAEVLRLAAELRSEEIRLGEIRRRHSQPVGHEELVEKRDQVVRSLRAQGPGYEVDMALVGAEARYLVNDARGSEAQRAQSAVEFVEQRLVDALGVSWATWLRERDR
jgi:endonuclease/exonuclease/phosphatase (EEP) superfamily protein YafD